MYFSITVVIAMPRIFFAALCRSDYWARQIAVIVRRCIVRRHNMHSQENNHRSVAVWMCVRGYFQKRGQSVRKILHIRCNVLLENMFFSIPFSSFWHKVITKLLTIWLQQLLPTSESGEGMLYGDLIGYVIFAIDVRLEFVVHKICQILNTKW